MAACCSTAPPLQEEWAGKLRDAEAARERAVAAAQASGEQQAAAVRAEVSARDVAISDLERELAARDDRIEQLGALVRGSMLRRPAIGWSFLAGHALQTTRPCGTLKHTLLMRHENGIKSGFQVLSPVVGASLPRQVAALEGGKAELARQVAALQQHLEAAEARGRQLQAALRQEHQLVGDLQAQVRESRLGSA